jgi:hypothetical protein
MAFAHFFSVSLIPSSSDQRFEADVLLVGDCSQLSSAVLKVSIEDINDGVQCVAVEWLHTVYDSRVTAEQHLNADCFTLSSEIGGHWYGGPEVLEQRWPIDLQKSTAQSHVTGDFLSPKWRRQLGFGYCRAILGNFDRDRDIGRRRIRFPAKINTTYIPLDPEKHCSQRAKA